MRNLLQFIIKHSNLLLFILLEVAAFLLIATSRPYQSSKIVASNNRLLGSWNEHSEHIRDYFHLNEQNHYLAEENAQLQQQINDLQGHDFTYQSAKVIDLTTSGAQNHFTINKGSEDGICVNMGVRNHDGVVGVVSDVGNHYAVCVPLIHTQNHLSCRLKRNRYIGFTEWNGTNYRYINLSDIARHVDVGKGDTVVTSGLTQSFDADVPIGVVDKVNIGNGDNYHNIRVRLFVDYKTLEYVEVIKRNDLD